MLKSFEARVWVGLGLGDLGRYGFGHYAQQGSALQCCWDYSQKRNVDVWCVTFCSPLVPRRTDGLFTPGRCSCVKTPLRGWEQSKPLQPHFLSSAAFQLVSTETKRNVGLPVVS